MQNGQANGKATNGAKFKYIAPVEPRKTKSVAEQAKEVPSDPFDVLRRHFAEHGERCYAAGVRHAVKLVSIGLGQLPAENRGLVLDAFHLLEEEAAKAEKVLQKTAPTK